MSAGVTASLGLEIANFRQSLAEARKLLKDFKTQMQPAGSGSGKQYAAGFKETAGGVALGTIIADGLKKAVSLAMDLGRAAGRQFITGAQEAASQERLEISFEILTGSAGGGRALFQELREDALRSGRDIDGMADSMRRFLAMDMSVPDALKLNRSLLDIAGSLGMSNEESKLLGMALSQVMAKGVASMEELRQQIAERGVPVFDVLADKLGVTTGALIKMVSEGKVGADVVIEAFMNLEGRLERFRGGLDRTANSSTGAWAIIAQHISDVRRLVMEPVNDAMKPVWQEAIASLKEMKTEARGFGEGIAAGIDHVIAGFTVLKESNVIGVLVGNLQAGFKMAANFLSDTLIGIPTGFTYALGAGLAGGARLFMALLSEITKESFWGGLRAVFLSIVAVLRAGLIEAVASVLEKAKGIPGLGNKIGDTPDVLRAEAAGIRSQGAAYGASAGRTFGLAEDRLLEEFRTVVKGIGAVYEAGRGTAPKFGTYSVRSIDGMGLIGRFAELLEQRALARRDADGDPGGGGDEGAKGAGVVTGGGVSGVFSQAINTALGRSVYEVAAATAQKTLEATEKGNAKLDALNTTMERVVTNLSGRDDIKIDVRPVFSSG